MKNKIMLHLLMVAAATSSFKTEQDNQAQHTNTSRSSCCSSDYSYESDYDYYSNEYENEIGQAICR